MIRFEVTGENAEEFGAELRGAIAQIMAVPPETAPAAEPQPARPKTKAADKPKAKPEPAQTDIEDATILDDTSADEAPDYDTLRKQARSVAAKCVRRAQEIYAEKNDVDVDSEDANDHATEVMANLFEPFAGKTLSKIKDTELEAFIAGVEKTLKGLKG